MSGPERSKSCHGSWADHQTVRPLVDPGRGRQELALPVGTWECTLCVTGVPSWSVVNANPRRRRSSRLKRQTARERGKLEDTTRYVKSKVMEGVQIQDREMEGECGRLAYSGKESVRVCVKSGA